MILEKTVRNVLREKGSSTVLTVAPEQTMYEALCIMARHNVGALLVCQGETILGLISERDYARKVQLAGRSIVDTPVREIMSGNILFVVPDDPIGGVLALMTDRRIRHLPVLDGGKLAGMISIGDVVKSVISDQDYLIHQLVRYVTGADYGWHEMQAESGGAAVEARTITRSIN